MDSIGPAPQDHLPRLRRTAIIRPRLIERLLDRFEKRLTVIVAGAGYGKTTLLVQAMDENRHDPSGIDRYIALSVGREPLTRALAQAFAVMPEPGEVVEAVVDFVWNEAPKQVAMILDDLHNISAEVASNGDDEAVLQRLLTRLPVNGHIVVASRHEPPLARSRLEALGEIAHLTARDLEFTSDEVVAFAEARGADPEPLQQMGGWPALAELASMRQESLVEDFLWEEVAEQLPPNMLELLAALVVLGASTTAVLSAALERDVAESDAADLPLVSSYGNRFEAHGLWATALSDFYDLSRRQEMLSRAAAVYQEAGSIGDAIAAYRTAELWGDALELAATAACDVEWASLPLVDLDELLRDLPEEFKDRPDAALVTGLVLRSRDPGNAEAAAWLREAAEGYRQRGESGAQAASLAHLSYIYRVNGDNERLVAIQERVEELADQGVALAGALAAVGRADRAFRSGRPDEAIEILRGLPPHALPSEWSVTRLWIEGMSLWMLGAPAQALALAEELDALDTPMLPGSQSLPAILRWFSGDLAGAFAVADRLDRQHGLLERDRSANSLIHGVLASIAGDEARAEAALAELASTTGSMADPLAAGQAELVRAVLAHNLGHPDRAATTLNDLVAIAPMSEPAIEQIARYGFGSMYLLVPEAREHWNNKALSGTWAEARAWASAIHARRSGNSQPARLVDVGDSAGRIVAHLGIAAACEFAAMLESVGRVNDGRHLAEELSALLPATRPALRYLSDGSSTVAKAAARLLAEVPDPPRQHVEVAVLGPVQIRLDGKVSEDTDLRRPRVQALLGWLVSNKRSTSTAASAVLWPDSDPDNAAHSLRVALGQLRQALEPERARGEASWFIRRDGPALHLLEADQALVVDAWEFDRLTDEALEADHNHVPSVALDRYLAALGRYHGVFLDGLEPDEWIEFERDRLRLRFVQASSRAGDLLLATGRNDQALVLGMGALAAEPWSEPAHRVVVAAHLANGDRAAARRALERCHVALKELGVEPQRATSVLAGLVQKT